MHLGKRALKTTCYSTGLVLDTGKDLKQQGFALYWILPGSRSDSDYLIKLYLEGGKTKPNQTYLSVQ